jgi:predicted nucleic acid-binding protein
LKTVFVDTNVILDVLLQNDHFFEDSLHVFQMAERREIRACVSASSMTDIFYITRKSLEISTARDAICNLLGIFNVVEVSGEDLKEALRLPISDLEDALQLWCALKSNAEVLITRDLNDFQNIEIQVLSPAEFVNQR